MKTAVVGMGVPATAALDFLIQFLVCSIIFLSPLRAIKSAVTASTSIMFCSLNGLAIIEYTRYTVQSNNSARIISRTILLS